MFVFLSDLAVAVDQVAGFRPKGGMSSGTTLFMRSGEIISTVDNFGLVSKAFQVTIKDHASTI